MEPLALLARGWLLGLSLAMWRSGHDPLEGRLGVGWRLRALQHETLSGNTVVVTPYGDPFNVRLSCSQAPALARGPVGEAAQASLAQLLPPGTWVTLASRQKAVDGVEQVEILAAGTSQPLNLTLVELGLALWDHRTGSLCDRQRYSQAERAARRRRLGLWGPAPAAPGMRP